MQRICRPISEFTGCNSCALILRVILHSQKHTVLSIGPNQLHISVSVYTITSNPVPATNANNPYCLHWH